MKLNRDCHHRDYRTDSVTSGKGANFSPEQIFAGHFNHDFTFFPVKFEFKDFYVKTNLIR